MAMSRKALTEAHRRRQLLSPPRSEEEILAERAIQNFIDLLGGKQAIIDTLTLGGAGPEVQRVLGLFTHPNAGRTPLSKLCTQAGITLAELFVLVGKARMQRAVLEAQDKIAAGMVAVVEDVMRRAAPIEVACSQCAGIGTIHVEGAIAIACSACRGTGKSVALPELDRQKVALDLAKLLPKAERPMVAVQNNFASGGRSAGSHLLGGIEQLQAAVNDCLFASPAPALPAPDEATVEAEVIPPETP